jgi:hypothetical protein
MLTVFVSLKLLLQFLEKNGKYWKKMEKSGKDLFLGITFSNKAD